jgi:copper transport protein
MWSSRDRCAAGAAVAVAALAAVAFLFVGVGGLASAAPAARSAPGTEPLPSPARISGATVGDLVVTVSAAPNRPGVNEFTVQVASSRRPPPARVDGVQLAGVPLDAGAGLLPLQPTAPDVYTGTGRLPAAGPVRITVLVRRAGQRLAVPMSWSVGPAAAPIAAPAAGPAPGRATDPTGLRSAGQLLIAPMLGALALGLRRLFRARSRRSAAATAECLDRVPEAVS